jgi:hypothetical protein
MDSLVRCAPDCGTICFLLRFFNFFVFLLVIGGNMVKLHNLRELVKCAAHKQLLLVDTNVALHQIDILEHKSPVTAIVVILQTVLEEVRHLNISVYRRLLALIQDESRAFIFFPNEICERTFAVRNQNEVCGGSSILLSSCRLIAVALLFIKF